MINKKKTRKEERNGKKIYYKKRTFQVILCVQYQRNLSASYTSFLQ